MHLRAKLIPVCSLVALLCLSAQAQKTPVKTSSAKPAALPAKKAAQKPAETVISVTVRANAEVSGRSFTLGEIGRMIRAVGHEARMMRATAARPGLRGI